MTAIAARINDEDRSFEIHRDDFAYFESEAGSAYNLYRRVVAGHWTAADLLEVLRFAAGRRPTGDVETYRARRTVAKVVADNQQKPCFVKEAFAAKGPAIYAPLAMQILAAALFQPKPDELTFTDEATADGE